MCPATPLVNVERVAGCICFTILCVGTKMGDWHRYHNWYRYQCSQSLQMCMFYYILCTRRSAGLVPVPTLGTSTNAAKVAGCICFTILYVRAKMRDWYRYQNWYRYQLSQSCQIHMFHHT